MFSKELRKSRYVCVFFKKKHMCFCLLMSNSQSFCISPSPQSISQIPWGCLVEMHLEKQKINFQGGGHISNADHLKEHAAWKRVGWSKGQRIRQAVQGCRKQRNTPFAPVDGLTFANSSGPTETLLHSLLPTNEPCFHLSETEKLFCITTDFTYLWPIIKYPKMRPKV